MVRQRMIRSAMLVVATIFLLLTVSSKSFAQERVINKADADEIFALDKVSWESRARQFVHPQGWTVRLQPVSTGTGVMSFDRMTGMGLSIQPLFSDELGSTPNALVVTSHYPLGSSLTIPKDSLERIERDVRADLGSDYDIKVRIFDVSRWRAVELLITPKSK